MSDRNNITGEVKELLLADLLQNSKKHRIKSIAERYGIRLPEKLTKQQMIDAALPAVEANFGTKLKHYTNDELFSAMECFTEREIPVQTVNKIMDSSPFADGGIFITCKKDSFFAAVPHELAGKLMTQCVTRCFDVTSESIDICAKACASIYGKFTAQMLADTANAALSLNISEDQAEKYLGSCDSTAFSYLNGAAECTSGVATVILPEAAEAQYYIPTRHEIQSYAAFGADTSDYYYRQIINFIYNNAGITYDDAGMLMRDISLWCTDNKSFRTLLECIKKTGLRLSTDRLKYLLEMIEELNLRTRKPCLKGHTACEIEGYKLPTVPDVIVTAGKSEPIRIEHKIGRNDPCPCGSGKKYKKCCGKNK